MTLDIEFWHSVKAHDFQLPHGHPVGRLTAELVAYLGTPNSELREMSFLVLGEWIGAGVYAPHELTRMGDELLVNLGRKIGDEGTDSVLLRSFSALVLGKIIDYDTTIAFLSKSRVRAYLEAGLTYLADEHDLRGYVPEKGWIHTPAHTADFLAALAKNPRLDGSELEQILDAIAAKITARLEHVFLRLEDERLAYAAVCALRRDLIGHSFLDRWCAGLAEPSPGTRWPDLIEGTEAEISAWHNTRDFMRSLFFQLNLNDNPPSVAKAVLASIEATLRAMDLGFYRLP